MKKKQSDGSSSDVSLSISLNEGTQADHKSTLAALKKGGFTATEEFSEIGVVLGKCAADKVTGLRAIKGVGAVEEEQKIQLPPPQSDIQ